MKESEFIELLNLYLDHEISAADAARLESEVQTHAARRKVYQQYCRMQKACKVLAADFQTEEAVDATAEKKIVAFDPSSESTSVARRKRANGYYTVGAFAAMAACIAIIFVGRSRLQQSESAMQGQGHEIAQAVRLAPEPAEKIANVTPPPRGSRPGGIQRATLVADPLLLTGNTHQADQVLTAAMKEANEQLDWIRTVQLAPLQQQLLAEQLRFDLPPATLRPESRAIRANRAPTEAAVEMTAFQFVK